MCRLIIILILCIFSQIATLPETVLATENYCHDNETNAHWDDIATRAIAAGNSDMINLYKLRKKLCAQIDAGEISVEDATEIFEDERSRVVEKLQSETA